MNWPILYDIDRDILSSSWREKIKKKLYFEIFLNKLNPTDFYK